MEIPELTFVNSELINRILGSLVVIGVVWFIYRILGFAMSKKITEVRLRASWKQSMRYALSLAAVVVIAQIWFEQLESIVTVLSLIAAALTIIHKEAILNVSGWMIILWRGLFSLGDHVSIKGMSGEVISMGLMYFRLAEHGKSSKPTGAILGVPNATIITDTVKNYSRDFVFVWAELTVKVGIRSDWKLAESILQEIVGVHSYKPGERELQILEKSDMSITGQELQPEVLCSVEGDKIEFLLRILCKPKHNAQTLHAVWHDILARFAEQPSIDFNSSLPADKS